MVEYHPQLDPRHRRFEKIWNTYVRIKLPWVKETPDKFWETRVTGDRLGPQQYVKLQESSSILIEEVIRHAPNADSRILDLGCNVGRHLNMLYERRFTNLHGVDVLKSVVEDMSREFPKMAKEAHIEQASFQEYLPKVPDCFFEVVFTHGATVELIRPEFSICQHMARTASKAVVMVISEGDHSFPRLWEKEFLREKFLLTKLLRPVHPGSGASLLTFERMT